MATRQETWIANEILRFTDIIHDCLDACRYLLKGIEPDTGIALEVPTDAELRIRSHSNAALINKAALTDFVTKIGTAKVQDALTTMNIDASIVRDDINKMATYADYIYNNVLTEDHAVMAEYLDTNLPKFISVRRRWAI